MFLLFIQLIPSQISNIKQLLTRQQADWNNGDIEAYMQGYWKNDSLVFVGKKGLNYGWQTTLDNYKKAYPNPEAMGKLSFTDLKINPLKKDFATVSGAWQLLRKNDQLNGRFTLFLQKRKGNWEIIYDHSS